MSNLLSGIYPAFLTPLDEQRRFNPAVAESMLEYLLGAGVDGTYVAGSTGEGMKLEPQDRRAVVETLMKILPSDRKLFVHVGATSVEEAVSLAEHAAKSGAHAISSLPPEGDRKAVFSYYETLARKSPLPLILYYFPKVAPDAFRDPADLIEICDLPNVVGVKFTDFNFFLLQQLVTRGKTVFNGYDEALGAGLLMGAQGGIGSTYNLMPGAYLELFKCAQNADWNGVRSWQASVNAIISVLVKYPFFPAVRAAVKFRGFDCGPMMSTSLLSPEQTRALHSDLSAATSAQLAPFVAWPGMAGEK